MVEMTVWISGYFLTVYIKYFVFKFISVAA
jgi:hypothetical protein